jgi:hypothetical protein
MPSVVCGMTGPDNVDDAEQETERPQRKEQVDDHAEIRLDFELLHQKITAEDQL